MSRKAAWLLVATFVWTTYVWTFRVYTLLRQHHSLSFKLVHVVLAAISLGLGAGVGVVGFRALRARRAA